MRSWNKKLELGVGAKNWSKELEFGAKSWS